MKFKKEYLFAIALLACSSALILYSNTDSSSISLEHSGDISLKDSPERLDNQQTTASVEDLDILTLKTFRFASVDGKLRANRQGNLILDRELRHWLDFHLSALGELSLEQVTLIMKREILKLPAPANEQALSLLSDYLSYKEALSDYDQRESLSITNADNIEQLQSRLDWQMRMRRQWLSEGVVESFWQLDEIIDNYALQKLTIRNSPISQSEKQLALEELENNLPDDLSSFKKEVYIASNLLAQEKLLKGDSENSSLDSAEDIRQLRINAVGEEAADRLEKVDLAQSAWRNKLIEFQQEENRIMSEEGISSSDKQQKILEFKQAMFSDKEQLRLKVALQLLSSDE